MRDRQQIREAIESATDETGGWDSPATWSQIADVLAVLLAPAQSGGGEVEREYFTDEWSDAERDELGRTAFDATPALPNPTASQRWEERDDREWWIRRAVNFARDKGTIHCAADPAVRAKATEIRARRKPAPEPVSGDAAHAPDALRKRAIQCAADAAGVSAEAARDAVERSPRGEAARYVAAVERALREATTIRECEMCRRPAQFCGVCRGEPDHLAGTAPDFRDESDRVARSILGYVDTRRDEIQSALVAAYQRGRADAATPREEPAPAGVLAVVERTAWTGRHSGYVRASDIDIPPGSPNRVTVAVLTGDVARIVEAHRARETYRKHVAECPETCAFFGSNGMPDPSHACAEGQRIAAAIQEVTHA